MQSSCQDLGQWAEQTALALLQSHHYECVARNYHSRYGEIDLVVQRQHELVFVEVKARSAGSYAAACEVISPAQQQKIIKTAQLFLQKYPKYYDFDCRFDVICFDFPRKFAKTVQPDFSKLQYDQQWIEHAFTLDG
ncbi:TIGR00252 family protein [Acinetobacter sp. WC-323]|uniref:YraN family protein n=1 Tax=Acinetobacter sp. WC-323 TaxID=903918 RepID=UPI00029EA955|nr:YraN family protein [Acinetobacter sp. WC-323]EKU56690.1 TIGR00252 family protein [Acinetobacter sp. WC-323]